MCMHLLFFFVPDLHTMLLKGMNVLKGNILGRVHKCSKGEYSR